MGIAYSLVPATVWSSISYVIPEPLAGTGFGVMTAIMSFTYLIIPSGVGAIHDFWNSYDYMNYLFALCALISFGGVIWIAKIEPDLNLSPRARRRDLSSYNVLASTSDSDDESDDEDNASEKTKLKPEDNFSLIRDRFAGPTSPQRGHTPRKTTDETELLTVTEDEYKLQSDDEGDSVPGFSSSVIPDSWLTNIKRGIDPVDNPVSTSLPNANTYMRENKD